LPLRRPLKKRYRLGRLHEIEPVFGTKVIRLVRSVPVSGSALSTYATITLVKGSLLLPTAVSLSSKGSVADAISGLVLVDGRGVSTLKSSIRCSGSAVSSLEHIVLVEGQSDPIGVLLAIGAFGGVECLSIK